MASTFTTNLRLELQASGENKASWGEKANTVFELIEEALTGSVSVPIADADTELIKLPGVSDQARNMFLKFTGTLTANRTVTIPNTSKIYIVQNNTTGGFAVIMKPLGSTSTYTVVSGQHKLVYTDGTTLWTNDQLLTASAANYRWGIPAYIAPVDAVDPSTPGAMEIGRYLDFHNANIEAASFIVRLDTGATDTDLYITPSNPPAAPGRKIWNSGNDGSGSGLDADLLDGLHANQIQFPDAPADNKTYVRKNNAWLAVDVPWIIDTNGDCILKFAANTVIRIKSTGLILTKDDLEIFSVSV